MMRSHVKLVAVVALLSLGLAGSCGQDASPATTDELAAATPPDSPATIAPPTTPAAGIEEVAAVPSIGEDDEIAGDGLTEESFMDALGSDEDAFVSATLLGKAEAIYASVLGRVVSNDGLVRYELLADAGMEGSLHMVVQAYATANLPEETPAKLAFWCNAYNANVLAMALEESRGMEFETVRAVKGFFDERTITVGGESLTLNALENDHIRPLDDPRIHAALVCAAQSCPPLRNEPYRADLLDGQLEDQCRRWINNPTKNGVADGALTLSPLFEWYGTDFETPRYKGVIGFVRAYADPDGAVGRLLIDHQKPLITWLEYDWTLNQAPGGPEGSK